jgi:hypothetical protein
MNRASSTKRTLSAAVVAALVASLAFSGLAAAKDNPNKGKGKDKQRTEQVQPHGNAQPAGATQTSLKVKGNASHPGGVFRVLAVLKAPKDARPDTIDAVVHFATGDLEVELTRSGGGAAYHAFVPVPDDEPEGTVLIDATADVDGETLEATGSGKILDRGEGEDEVSEEAVEEEESSPAASESGEICEPEASPSGDPSADPSESADSEECSEEPTFELTKEIIAAVLAYLQSIFA